MSPFSSVSQVTSSTRSSRLLEKSQGQQNDLESKLPRQDPVRIKTEPDENLMNVKCRSEVKEGRNVTLSGTGSADLDPETVEETASELSSFTLGEPTIKRNNSGTLY